jgi:hypothetical protein
MGVFLLIVLGVLLYGSPIWIPLLYFYHVKPTKKRLEAKAAALKAAEDANDPEEIQIDVTNRTSGEEWRARVSACPTTPPPF